MDGKQLKMTIDGSEVMAHEGATVLEAARQSGIYIPTLCNHPDLQPFGACRLCICQIDGVVGFPVSCAVTVADGMKVRTDTDRIKELRREVLSLLLERHPHACLTCAQREGCTRDPCSTDVPVEERCCPKFNNCEFQRVVEYIGIKDDTPRYVHRGERVFDDDPLIFRDFNLCILCGRCVQACRDLRGIGVLGFINRGYGSQARTAFDAPLMDSDCMFCTTCVEVCPTGTLRDKDLDKGVPEDALVPCRSNCPAGMDVPRFIDHVLKDEMMEAAAVLYETLPIPRIIGLTCHHPCENRCRRGLVNEAIAINDLERSVALGSDGVLGNLGSIPSTGKKVAVLGADPTGLSVAYFLNMKGHRVAIFDNGNDPVMTLGRALDGKVPRRVLEKEIGNLKEQGIEISTSFDHRSLGSIRDKGFDGVFVVDGGRGISEDLMTVSDGVFKGGSFFGNDLPLIEVVAASKGYASEMDRYLQGDGRIELHLAPEREPDGRIGLVKSFARRQRVAPTEREGIRVLDPRPAKDEALRCLRCHLRLTLSPLTRPPERIMALDHENLSRVPAAEGVYTLFDNERNILAIKGVDDLAAALREKLEEPGKVAFFDYEEDKMYSKRENEMLQVYIQVHGKMPEGAGGDDDLEDLF